MKNLNSYLKESLDIQEAKTIVNVKNIENFLKTNYDINGQYTIDQVEGEYVVNVKGNVFFDELKRLKTLTDGTFRFGVVEGTFSCGGSRGNNTLETLEGAPQECEFFKCADCYKLKSLEGAPTTVNSTFSCVRCNLLKDLTGAPQEMLNGNGNFSCSWCANLKTLEGAPKKCISFECDGCPNLMSLKGAPQEVDSIDISECPKLTNLNGLPKKIERLISAQSCPGLKGQKLPWVIKGKIDRGSDIKPAK